MPIFFVSLWIGGEYRSASIQSHILFSAPFSLRRRLVSLVIFLYFYIPFIYHVLLILTLPYLSINEPQKYKQRNKRTNNKEKYRRNEPTSKQTNKQPQQQIHKKNRESKAPHSSRNTAPSVAAPRNRIQTLSCNLHKPTTRCNRSADHAVSRRFAECHGRHSNFPSHHYSDSFSLVYLLPFAPSFVRIIRLYLSSKRLFCIVNLRI